jgi:hypothetical protein
VEFAGALARVAIASLGGPLAGIQEAAKEIAGHAGRRADAKAAADDLQNQVAEAIRDWAGAESVSAEDRDLGLALAAETIKRHGLAREHLASNGYDSDAVSDAVLARARAADRYWGTEGHYDIAERAVRSTYRALCTRLARSPRRNGWRSAVIAVSLCTKLGLDLGPSEAVSAARCSERRGEHSLAHPGADRAGRHAKPARHLTAGDQRFVPTVLAHPCDGRSSFQTIKT